jgi:hypothetical protein
MLRTHMKSFTSTLHSCELLGVMFDRAAAAWVTGALACTTASCTLITGACAAQTVADAPRVAYALPSASHRGAIIGGAIAGTAAVALAVAACAALLTTRRRRAARRAAPQATQIKLPETSSEVGASMNDDRSRSESGCEAGPSKRAELARDDGSGALAGTGTLWV